MDTFTLRLRPLGVIDLIEQAIRLYGRQFLTFSGIVAAAQVPALLLTTLYQVIVMGPMQQELFDPRLMRDTDALMNWYGVYCGATLGMLVLSFGVVVPLGVVMNGACAHAVSESYAGRNPGAVGAYAHMFSRGRWLKAIAVGLLLTLVATVLSLIPCVGWAAAIYLGMRIGLYVQVVSLEDLGPMDALRRIWNLVDGHLLRLLGLTLLVMGIIVGVSVGCGMVASMTLQPSALSGRTSFAVVTLAQSVISGVIQVVALPVYGIALTMFYFDLRVRKEGFGQPAA